MGRLKFGIGQTSLRQTRRRSKQYEETAQFLRSLTKARVFSFHPTESVTVAYIRRWNGILTCAESQVRLRRFVVDLYLIHFISKKEQETIKSS